MSEFLFRQEVAQFQNDPRFGAKVFYQPIQLRVFVIALSLIAIGFVVFASLAPVKQTELVRGHLDPKQGAMKVFSPGPGTVSEVLVREGQVVRKGQVLARIVRSTYDSLGQVAAEFTLAQIDAQIEQQSRQRKLLHGQSTLQHAQLTAKIAARQVELDATRAQLHIVEKRRALGAKSVQRQARLLALGQAARAQHEGALDSLYAIEQILQSLQAQIGAGAAQVLHLQQQLEQVPFTRAAQVLEIDTTLAQLRLRRKELEVGDAFSLTAPSNGIVSNLLSLQGAFVDPRVPFLTVLPPISEMQALLYVPSRALGKLAKAQQVLIAYDAYPSRVYGYFPARIERISNAVLDPREHIFPVDLQEPVYLVRASPDLSSEQDSEVLRFRSGMQFSAYVVTGQQSLLQRLLSPMLRLRSRV